jgi:fluoroacetyl-CoA thioesterase
MVTPGLTGTATLVVSREHTAEAFGSGLVPVFATPRMVSLMEQAAVAALEGHLEIGQTTVGTWIETSHLAATPVGMSVRAEAVLTAVEGRSLAFRVAAWDAVEKIGEGTHRRAIVSVARFLERASAKHAR